MTSKVVKRSRYSYVAIVSIKAKFECILNFTKSFCPKPMKRSSCGHSNFHAFAQYMLVYHVTLDVAELLTSTLDF